MIDEQRLKLMDKIAGEVTRAIARKKLDWRGLSRLAGVTEGSMSNLVYSHRMLKLATLVQIATAMGMEWEVRLVPMEGAGEDEEGGGVKRAVKKKVGSTGGGNGWKAKVKLGDEE